MPWLLPHKDTVFEDQVVYFAGHAYSGCTFRRCTIVARDGASRLEGCGFEACVWHLDMFVHDLDSWQITLQNLIPMIAKSLPKAPEPGSSAN